MIITIMIIMTKTKNDNNDGSNDGVVIINALVHHREETMAVMEENLTHVNESSALRLVGY